ncbi:MAG: VOC family protein [Gammaproteobacteria bacterium]|nr:VOC family protein [Gammaproteobacteria bacterium]
MLNILGIDHIVLRTTRTQKMLDFYQQVLGCKLERELPELGLIQLRAGSSLIDIVPVDSELGRLGGRPPSQDGRNLEHFCLTVAGVDEAQLLEFLAAHDIDAGEPAERYGASGFSRSVYINDPEGNVVELKLLAI